MEKEDFGKLLINWYKKNKRALPWRETPEPYTIWLSEILLQQTRVAQGLPYYNRFLESFPNIKALATASEKDVLRLWQGLGYYSRARNLHFTAKEVMEKHNGILPRSYKELLLLKGIGIYTAAAIASFAFGEHVAVVDGNVYRVLSRVYGVKEDIASPKGQKIFQELANRLLPSKNSSTYNQAIMEFGALHCTPKKPSCETCPFAYACFAFATESQSSLPVKLKKTVKKTRWFHYLVVKQGDNYLMKERKESDIWKGLYEFPLLEENKRIEIGSLLKKRYHLDGNMFQIRLESQEYKHILSHQTLYAIFWIIESKNINKQLLKDVGYQFYDLEIIASLPKSVLINKFLEEYLF